MVNNDRQGQPREVVFEVAATHYTSARMVVDQEEGNEYLNVVEEEDEEKSEGQDSVRTRRLSLMWDEAQAVARRGKNMDLGHLPHGHGQSRGSCGTFQLPPGITKDDIMVTIDIDDTARSSTSSSPSDGDALEGHVIPRDRCNTDATSNSSSGRSSRRQQQQQQQSYGSSTTTDPKRRDFEQAVQQSICEDLQSMYTGTPDTAKLVLCIVICILSDGSMHHTYCVGGRVGLAELALNWRLFGADDLKVYNGGLTVQRKDFGFGPLELTEAEGEYYVINKMAPQAANDIVRRIGGANEDFLADF